ncbi:hypothetical protein PCH_Pc22g21680 [Penicillium rubens Wisconsin 54-1255]|uniref:Uncharacterized protein n=1 Tax=Penicillium rubens (strain ATCC 28089 / DSM 1075 / NRRL 1951 / Wisconsin 54-1255) TaxID=500485 RepID=B6HSY1_PENRW|nr:hypothetical protein PCH_Pc22g21680 [Penicillium rubens Wisconsin 54-1255]
MAVDLVPRVDSFPTTLPIAIFRSAQPLGKRHGTLKQCVVMTPSPVTDSTKVAGRLVDDLSLNRGSSRSSVVHIYKWYTEYGVIEMEPLAPQTFDLLPLPRQGGLGRPWDAVD